MTKLASMPISHKPLKSSEKTHGSSRLKTFINDDPVQTLNCFAIRSDFMRGSRRFCRRGSNIDNVFFKLMKGEVEFKYRYKWAIIDTPAKRHLSETPFKWRFDSVLMVA